MGSSFIITESTLNKKGRELMLDFYNHIYDVYMLGFNEFKSQRKFYDENVKKIYLNFCSREKQYLFKEEIDFINKYDFDENDLKIESIEGKNLLMFIEDKIKNKTIEVEFVFDFLTKMDKTLNSPLEFEISEDLVYLRKAFLKAYDLFYNCGHELKD